MRYLTRVSLALITVILGSLLITAVTNAGDPKALEGKEVTIVFICKTPDALNNILEAKTSQTMTETANQYVASDICLHSPYPVPVDLTEYLGKKVVTATGFTGTAYLYRIEGNSGQSYYTFLFEVSQGA